MAAGKEQAEVGQRGSAGQVWRCNEGREKPGSFIHINPGETARSRVCCRTLQPPCLPPRRRCARCLGEHLECHLLEAGHLLPLLHQRKTGRRAAEDLRAQEGGEGKEGRNQQSAAVGGLGGAQAKGAASMLRS